MKLLIIFALLVATEASAANKVVVIPLGDSTYQLSIDPVENASFFVTVVDNIQTATVTTVPAGKTFVLTRAIVATNSAALGSDTRIVISENETTKTIIGRGLEDEKSFGTGIPFSPESTITLTRETSTGANIHFTLIGYFVSS